MGAMPEAKSRPPKTVEDYMALPDDVRAELIGGELYVTPAPLLPHQRATARLGRTLADHVERLELGEVVFSPMDVHLPTGDVVQPDLIFVSKQRSHICRDWIHGVPDLLIEVLSPSNAERDLVVKRELYARNEVPAYWIVDPIERSIQLLRFEDGAYEPEAYLHGEADLTTPSFPGLRVPLATIFR